MTKDNLLAEVSKRIRNVLIIDVNNVLTYLRAGLLDLSELDYIVFEPKN